MTAIRFLVKNCPNIQISAINLSVCEILWILNCVFWIITVYIKQKNCSYSPATDSAATAELEFSTPSSLPLLERLLSCVGSTFRARRVICLPFLTRLPAPYSFELQSDVIVPFNKWTNDFVKYTGHLLIFFQMHFSSNCHAFCSVPTIFTLFFGNYSA